MSVRTSCAFRFFLALIPVAPMVATPATAQAPWHMILGSEDSVDIGMLKNAPNGHISYQQRNDTLTLWVDGRVRNPKGTVATDTTQGTFILRLHPASWQIAKLEGATPVKVLEGVHDSSVPCTASNAWYRNYAAINAVIPGPSGQLLAFVDGEFHPKNTGTPLRASIGVATSTDNGMTWPQKAVIIQGNDIVAFHFNCTDVDKKMRTKADNVGAAGPSAVIRTEGKTKYVYLYYLDRVRFSTNGNPTSDIYVARAPYSRAGAPGSWQFWTGRGWSADTIEVIATPAITTPPHGEEAAHPQVTYNTALKRWLMVFHTRTDLYASTSEDGTTWDTPQALGVSIRGARSPAFPTLVTPGSGDQQTTGDIGWLFYSREVDVAPTTGKKEYLGFRRSFTLSIAGRKPPCATPQDCCTANGGTWSGGRCS